MKSLWEQYGLVIITIIAMAALIVITIVMKDQTTENIENNVNAFEQVGSDTLNDLFQEETT